MQIGFLFVMQLYLWKYESPQHQYSTVQYLSYSGRAGGWGLPSRQLVKHPKFVQFSTFQGLHMVKFKQDTCFCYSGLLSLFKLKGLDR